MSNRTDVRRVLDTVKAEGRTALTAPEGKIVCEAYGIAVPKEGVATSAADAATIAAGMGFPVVLKIVSPEILHKTEAGGVLVGVKSAEEAQKGYDTIIANAKKYNAKATILGVQVQQMLAGGQEVIIGAVTDPVFGKLVAFGLGGVLVEVLKDITFRLAPATEDDALSMLDGIAAAQILKGVRGADPVNRDALADDDPERVAAHRRLSGNRGDGPEPGLRHQGRRDRGRRPDRRQFLAGAGAVPPEARRHRARHEPHHEAEGGRRHRRLVGGRQDRQLGDEEPDQRRLQGADLPDQPVRRRDHGAEGVQERQGRSRRHRRRGVRDPGQVRGGGDRRVRREEDSGRRPHSVGICRDRQRRGTAGDRRGRPQVRRPPDGSEHLRVLLHVEQPLRDVLHRLRRQGQRGAVVAVGRHRDGHHRLLPLGEDGRLGHRRSGQQGGYRRGRSADVLRAGRQHADHRAALRGPEGRPRLCRSRQARVEEEAGRRAQGRTHRRWAPRRPARTPARSPATTRSTTMCSGSPA